MHLSSRSTTSAWSMTFMLLKCAHPCIPILFVHKFLAGNAVFHALIVWHIALVNYFIGVLIRTCTVLQRYSNLTQTHAKHTHPNFFPLWKSLVGSALRISESDLIHMPSSPVLPLPTLAIGMKLLQEYNFDTKHTMIPHVQPMSSDQHTSLLGYSR